MGVELSLIEQLCEFETALIAEGMGVMGCKQPEKHYLGQEIKLVTQLSEPTVGAAMLLTADTSTPGHGVDTAEYWKSLDMIRASNLPIMLIVKCIGSRPQHECVLGDGMAKMLKTCGSSGIITDGAARDVRQIDKAGYHVFATGTVADHASIIYKLSPEPVSISGITIKNGDLVHGDSDGVVVIPEEYHHGIVNACIAARDFETKVHTYWRQTDKTISEKKTYVMKMVEQRDEYYKTLMAKQ